MTPCSLAAAPWLARVDALAPVVVDMTIPIEHYALDMLTNMLIAPKDDSEAVDRTVQGIHAYYTARLFSPPAGDLYHDVPDNAARHIIGPVVDHVFELSEALSRGHIGHERLADVLLSLKKTATAEFDPENPQLAWYNNDINWHAAEIWQLFNVTHTASMQECTAALNTHALLALLIAADMYPEDGARRAAKCISEGLQDQPSKEFSADTPLVRTCRAVVATQYTLIAGDMLVREMKRMAGAGNGNFGKALRQGEWGFWVQRLGQLAGADGGEGVEEWDLKRSAEEAREKVEGWLSAEV